MTTALRTRADIEREIASKRRELGDWVLPENRDKVHDELNLLLDEWTMHKEV